MAFDQEYPANVKNDIYDDIGIYFSLQAIMEDNKDNDPFKQTQAAEQGSSDKIISWVELISSPNTKQEIQQKQQKPQNKQSEFKTLNKSGLFKSKSCRPKRYIEINQKKKRQYVATVKGKKQQTSELNINFKTLTKSFLRQEFLFNDFNKTQQDVIRNFQNSKANFQSFRQLFGVQQPMEYEDFTQANQIDEVIYFQRSQRRTQTQKSTKDIKSARDIKRKSRKHFTQHQNVKNYLIDRKCDRIRKLCLKNFTSCRTITQTLKSGKMNSYNKIVTLKFIQDLRDGVIKPEDFRSWKQKQSKRKAKQQYE